MILAFLLSLMSIAAPVQAAELHLDLPKGDYVYAHRYAIPQLRRSETVATNTQEGRARLAELRSDGFICIRRNETQRLCTKKEKPATWPRALDEAIERQMKGFTISFTGPFEEPRFVIDTSTEQEWLVLGKLVIREQPVTAYKVVIHYDTGHTTLAFPVNESQPIPYARYEAPDRLVLSFIVQAKDGAQNLGYFVETELTR